MMRRCLIESRVDRHVAKWLNALPNIHQSALQPCAKPWYASTAQPQTLSRVMRLLPAAASTALRPRSSGMSARSFIAVGDDLIQNATGNAMTTITVFGGTGFLGRRLVQRLAADAVSVRVAVRHPDPTRSALRVAGLNHITLFSADVRDQASVAAAVAGADAVVNAVSAYVETGGVTFAAVHEQGAETVAREAASAGVARLVLVSGIGADPKSGSAYIRARGRGELVVQQAFPGATIVRPGAMFGPGDALSGRSPTLPGCSRCCR